MHDPSTIIELKDERQRDRVIQTKATCPFIASAIAGGRLPVRNDAENPLASIEDVRTLGNHKDGSLGEVLALFATGNHAFMRDNDGIGLSKRVDPGLFSLDFPESQGSHPGDSGILQRDRQHPAFSEEDFKRLEGRAVNGRLTRGAVAEFITENVRQDPRSTTIGRDLIAQATRELLSLAFSRAVIPATAKVFKGDTDELTSAQREAITRFTKLLAKDNIAGSSGEFGLLFALLAETSDGDDEPFVLVKDLRGMFQRKELPAGWDQRRKTWFDWVKHTTVIAFKAYDAFER